jgi:OTU domain-containing protein 6
MLLERLDYLLVLTVCFSFPVFFFTFLLLSFFLPSVEVAFETKQTEMKARHEAELKAVLATAATAGGGGGGGTSIETEDAVVGVVATSSNDDKKESASAALASAAATLSLSPAPLAAAAKEEQRKEKLRLKKETEREKARAKERAREQAIVDENANAGPAARDVEMAILQSKLPDGMRMEEVTADGHCLYRAVAAQQQQQQHSSSELAKDWTYSSMRNLCADKLQEHEADFAPFCEYTDAIPDYATYVNRVRSSADWGGHLELRALSMALHRPVIVYSAAQSSEPLVIAEEVEHQQGDAIDNPIRLSYHLSYYSLGEHYNRVVATVQD